MTKFCIQKLTNLLINLLTNLLTLDLSHFTYHALPRKNAVTIALNAGNNNNTMLSAKASINGARPNFYQIKLEQEQLDLKPIQRVASTVHAAVSQHRRNVET